MKKGKFFNVLLMVMTVLSLTFGALGINSAHAASPTPLFTNGGFEAGDFSGWTQSYFLNQGLSGSQPYTGASIVRTPGGSDQSLVLGGPTTDPLSMSDANSGNNVQYPPYGNYVARVNGPTTGRISNTITQTVTVDADDIDSADGLYHVRFVYAAVMEDPGHDPYEQPWFFVKVTNQTKGTTLYEKFSYVNEPGVPWQTGATGWKYIDWTLVDIAGTGQIEEGDTLVLEAIAADCAASGHAGYVYVDAFGSQIPGPTVSASAPATANQGGSLTYTINYQNQGDAAANPNIRFGVPAQTTFASSSLPACVESPAGTVNCSLGASLGTGASGSFTITVSVDAGASGSISLGNYEISADLTPTMLGPLVTTSIPDITSPSVVSVTRASANPTSASSVNFTVTFSESVTGVDATDFALTTTGVSGTSVSGLSGSGSVYTISVNTGTGNGTIRLDVLDDDSVMDPVSNPLNGSFASGEVYTINKDAMVNVAITGALAGSYQLASGELAAQPYGSNSGPVEITSTNAINLIGSERAIYKVNGVNTSFSEMMGLPKSQLSTTYWLPWYNNVDLDTQLILGNVSGSTATVHVSIAGTPVVGSPFTLLPGQSTRVSFAGINNGPVKIQSNVNIVAAERVIYKVNEVNTSFSEMMGLPDRQLDTTYWFPWYNNVDLDTQLRLGNVSGSTATVHISVGGTPMAGSPFTLLPGQSTRVSFAGINDGLVKIVSDQNIVVAQRMIYKVNGIHTSFSELMGLPDNSLDITYWLPWYNNVDLDTLLRFGVP